MTYGGQAHDAETGTHFARARDGFELNDGRSSSVQLDFTLIIKEVFDVEVIAIFWICGAFRGRRGCILGRRPSVRAWYGPSYYPSYSYVGPQTAYYPPATDYVAPAPYVAPQVSIAPETTYYYSTPGYVYPYYRGYRYGYRGWRGWRW